MKKEIKGIINKRNLEKIWDPATLKQETTSNLKTPVVLL